MKKMIYKFKSFCKEEPVYVLSIFSSFLFIILDLLFENCGFYLLLIISAYSYFYCAGRYDEKKENKKCQ